MAISVLSSGLTNRRQSARAKARAKPGKPSGRPVYMYISFESDCESPGVIPCVVRQVQLIRMA